MDVEQASGKEAEYSGLVPPGQDLGWGMHSCLSHSITKFMPAFWSDLILLLQMINESCCSSFVTPAVIEDWDKVFAV